MGEHAAGLLAREFRNWDRLEAADAEALEAIDGIGPIVAQSLKTFVDQKANQQMVRQLLSCGLRQQTVDHAPTGGMDGKVFVITGTLQSLNRSQAKQAVEYAGGRVTSAVSRNTDFVVVGESPGSKLAKAESLGVAVLNEDQFRQLLETPFDT